MEYWWQGFGRENDLFVITSKEIGATICVTTYKRKREATKRDTKLIRIRLFLVWLKHRQSEIRTSRQNNIKEVKAHFAFQPIRKKMNGRALIGGESKVCIPYDSQQDVTKITSDSHNARSIRNCVIDAYYYNYCLKVLLEHTALSELSLWDQRSAVPDTKKMPTVERSMLEVVKQEVFLHCLGKTDEHCKK